MGKYDLSDEEDLRLRFSIMLPSKRSLYEYLCELPLEHLRVYPKKGYHWWMGRSARSPEALALRDYIWHWRTEELLFRKMYPREVLDGYSSAALQVFLRSFIKRVPLWVYADPVRDCLLILEERKSQQAP